MSGSLYLVAIPIGSPDDLTIRAREILGSVDFVIGEEGDTTDRFLKSLGLVKEIMLLNEHNEKRETGRILSFLHEGQSAALISDCGTPVVADPGKLLVQQAVAEGILLIPIPGASSLLAALVVSGFPIHKWYYRGFLSPKTELRRQELLALRDEPLTSIIMETPYRLEQLLTDMQDVLGREREIALCWQLTQKDESVVRGTIPQVLAEKEKRGWKKGEFVIVLNSLKSPDTKAKLNDRT